jgi:hypothetical protein
MVMRDLRGLVARAVWLVLLVFLGCSFAACGNGVASSFSDGGGPAEGGSGRRDGGAGDGTMVLHPPGGDSGPQGTLSVSPKTPILKVTNTSVPSQTFTASLDTGAVSKSVTAAWSLSDYTIGSITSGGVFTPAGTIGGTVNVIATYGALSAMAKLTIEVSLSTNLPDVVLPDGTVISEASTAITAPDFTALTNGPSANASDSGAPSTIIYPYDKTVFPLGLLAPVVQLAPGAVAPVDFKVSLDTTDYHWDGFGHVGNPAALQAAIPQSAWDGALASSTGSGSSGAVVLSVVTAANGVAYGPATANLTIANGKLTGVIYYESYSTDPIDGGADAPGTTDFGLWAVKPGQVTPPQHLEPGCVICHGVAANGSTLTNGTDDPANGPLTGVFRVEADGGYTHLATAPLALPYNGGGGGTQDSRGLGWGTVSPDGTVILRGVGDFWGGQELLAWATPSQPLLGDGGVQPLSTSMQVHGGFNMFVPQYSEDGKHLVYVAAAGADGGVGDATNGVAGPPTQIGTVDIATELTDAAPGSAGDGGYGSVTLTNPVIIYNSATAAPDAGGGTATKVPTFLPDSTSIVFEETRAPQYPQFNFRLPDDGPVDGELAMLQKTPAGPYVRVALANANAGYDPASPTVNYEPKPLPVSVGGYYWVVFASTRSDAYPKVGAPKKLWVTAISPGGTPGVDPSHPPFTLINQAIVSPQRSQRAYWALAPCLGLGASCQSGNDCCNGSCIPESSDPSSPLVCKAPSMGCAAVGGRCAAGQSEACCGASSGVQCIGTLNGYGTCAAPGPPP